jgi:hypothetical protein
MGQAIFEEARREWNSIVARLAPANEGTAGATDFKWRSASDRISPETIVTNPDLTKLMPDQTQSKQLMRRRFGFLRVPLFRLLAINLAAGMAVAGLLVGGLLALNPGGLRDLIFADASPGTALGLLLFGFVVTFGSAAMGSAIMAMGLPKADNDNRRGPPRLVAQKLRRAIAPASRQR